VTAVEANGVSHKESSHYLGKGDKSGSEKKMVRDEHPCVTAGFDLWQEFRKALQEILTVPFVHEDFSTLYPPHHDVVQDPGRVQTGLSRHVSLLHQLRVACQLTFLSASLFPLFPYHQEILYLDVLTEWNILKIFLV
jgi:hypothetical protein